MRLPILYEDLHLVVVDKPAGLLSVPDRHDADLPNVLSLLRRQLKADVWPVHRLDKPTSGLLAIARNPEAQRNLSRQFEQRTVDKTYLALVEGRPPEASGEINVPLAPHPTKAGRMMIAIRGKEARTRYRHHTDCGPHSLLEVDLLTGRTHQIRIHLQHLGFPLLVDPFYGKRDALYLSHLKKRRYNLKRGTEERPLLDRVPLHAHRLGFDHPAKLDRRISLESPLPKDIRATVRQLQKL